MAHRIKTVIPLENCMLSVIFQNGVEKKFDLYKMCDSFPQFRILEENRTLFEQVKVDVGGYGIYWDDQLDLDAEEIWDEGIQVNVYEVDVVYALAESLIRSREKVGMTQKRLAEVTGIYQADISKIERGRSNPSLSTLKRLAEGMGMSLVIEFQTKK